ncbi:MAG: transporter substrate-binding domain-containing protein [Gammaproteobacteria bacterium]|nr:transporter substrate-binding domain-containing protein [Gammaproteobacteria bacterium]MBU1601725.1 transporter substrate-binding domain-containing protein [Gammaproteobacteria bacterium]MBU2432097.1 transporter substrate-binding domain-containing protein [Gammaproteobacteria bacterium]MBU2450510.1 transporter substrate-binding domain-containing protein [Gammaproteobacteria bacterium]
MTCSNRRPFFLAFATLLLICLSPVQADEQMDTIRKRGRLQVAVYNNFPPYSDAGKGIDVELGQALAAKLGLQAEIIGFMVGEDMNDDLRNMVWKGHYLRGNPADVMMRVPVDAEFAKANDKVRIFAPYHHEVMGMARVAKRIPAPSGSAAVALEVFTREKIGVEIDTLAASFLGSVLHGRLRSNVVHFHSIKEAAKALGEDSISAIMAPLGELEGNLAGDTRFAIGEAKLGELRPKSWLVGMAVKAEADELAAALSGALSELQKDGTVAAIFERHGVTLHTR